MDAQLDAGHYRNVANATISRFLCIQILSEKDLTQFLYQSITRGNGWIGDFQCSAYTRINYLFKCISTNSKVFSKMSHSTWLPVFPNVLTWRWDAKDKRCNTNRL